MPAFTSLVCHAAPCGSATAALARRVCRPDAGRLAVLASRDGAASNPSQVLLTMHDLFEPANPVAAVPRAEETSPGPPRRCVDDRFTLETIRSCLTTPLVAGAGRFRMRQTDDHTARTRGSGASMRNLASRNLPR